MKYTITLLLAVLLPLFSTPIFAQDGELDPTFNPTDAGYPYGFDGVTASFAFQADGKMLVGGNYHNYGSQNCNGLVRLNTDDSNDLSFNIGTGVDGFLETVVLQPDGKILIGGAFSTYNGVARSNIARLNADGSLDTSFNVGLGTNNRVYKTLVQPDGKIIIVGQFSTYNGVAYNNIARLNTDGSLDTSFVIGTGAYSPNVGSNIRGVALQNDGKIIAVGGFSSFNGAPKSRVVRLNTDGSVDTSFIPNYTGGSLFSVTVQDDGRIYIGGYDNGTVSALIRLNTNGSADTTFAAEVPVYTVLEIVIQPDGKILAGGNNIVRLNQDGTPDSSFFTSNNLLGAGSTIFGFALTPGNKIIVGGGFTLFYDEVANYIIRLNLDGTKDNTYNYVGGTGADASIVSALKQNDDKIIITGQFSKYNGTFANRIARLSSSGILDTSYITGTGANSLISGSANVANGKIVIVGSFTSYNGTPVNKIARINANGTLDTSFNLQFPLLGAGDYAVDLRNVAVQSDGKVIVGGSFISYNGSPLNRLCRLNTDGSIDASFNAAFLSSNSQQSVHKIIVLPNDQILIATSNTGTSAQQTLFRLNADGSQDTSFSPLQSSYIRDVDALAVQADGKVLVGGRYYITQTNFNYRFMRVNADGTVDDVFQEYDLETAFFSIDAICPQFDGKIIIAGGFTDYNGVAVNNLARLNADGTLDATFDSGLSAAPINTLVAQQDKLIIAGDFMSYNGTGRNRIARIGAAGILNTDAPVIAPKNNLAVYAQDNVLNIKSSQKVIALVSVFDLQGRLVASQNNVKSNFTGIKNISAASKILIVKVQYADNSSETKKIYY